MTDPSPTPFDTAAWHAGFDAAMATFQSDALDLGRLAVFTVALVGGVVATALFALVVAQLRVR